MRHRDEFYSVLLCMGVLIFCACLWIGAVELLIQALL